MSMVYCGKTYCMLFSFVFQLGPQVGITFSVFSFMQPLLLNYMYDCNGDCLHKKGNAHTAQDLLLATTIAGGMSGFVSKVMCYPLDLAKRRLQIAVGILLILYFRDLNA